jgi:putative ABC transport system permease protein
MRTRNEFRLIFSLLRWICPPDLYEEIEGDLIQRFHRDVKKVGEAKAKKKLIWNTLRFFRPAIILRNKFSMELIQLHMLRTDAILAGRNMIRNKAFSLINVLGMSVSITVSILILLFVRFELSYDNFHRQGENIYRVSTKVTLQNEVINHETNTYEGIGKALKENFSEVQAATSIYAFNSDKTFIRYEDKEKRLVPLQTFQGLDVDSSFFSVFSFPLAEGNPKIVLREPYSALISESLSSQYFEGNSIGKVLEVYDGETYNRFKITGILKNIPSNSHVKFDLVTRAKEKNKNFWNGDIGFWEWGGQTYIRLNEFEKATTLRSKLDALASSNNGLKKDKNDYGQVSTFDLQRLRDIHLYSHLNEEFEVNGSAMLVFSLIFLAGIIVLVAWINYINLATAMADDKAKSIGIRKVIGASRTELISQVMTEAGVFNVLAVFIGFMMVHLLFPFYSNSFGVSLDYSALYNFQTFTLLGGFIFLSTLIAGFYPAFVISRFNPLTSIINKSSAGNGFTFRKVLVVSQFFAATVLMIVTVVAYRQLSFMRNKELGINIDQVVVIKALNFDKETWSNSAGGFVVDSAYQQKLNLFKDALRANATFTNVTSISHLPGELPNWGSEFKATSIDPNKAYRLLAMGVDYDFISTFKVTLLAGRNFSEDFPTDRGNEGKRAVLINEAASKLLGFKSPTDAVHSHISSYWGADYEIIGVVNSFHQLSLKESLQPIYFILQPRALAYYAVNFKNEDMQHVLGQLQRSWQEHFPDYPFNYFFLDQFYDRQYQYDQQFSNIMSLFSGLAVFMACLGLFGLTSYAVVRRTKEIGIRKVLGAGLLNVMALFTHDFARLIVVANAVAIPLVYYGCSRWLENYAYKIPLDWRLFVIPAIMILSTALITVALQTLKVALRNPVESLHHE